MTITDLKNTINDLETVLDYILTSELDDFKYNPSEEHIYFKAFSLFYSRKDAEKMLEETINKGDID